MTRPIWETHRNAAPGVWLPKETTQACTETFGPWMCASAKDHKGPHRNAHGEVIGEVKQGEQIDVEGARRYARGKGVMDSEPRELFGRLAERVRLLEQRLAALGGSEHVLVLSDGRWTVEHTLSCRESGRMSECDVHQRIADWIDEVGEPDLPKGRYIVGDGELPEALASTQASGEES